MAKKSPKSIEEQIETLAKAELHRLGIHAYAKTEEINPEISNALTTAPSKSGGRGNNFPDIKLFLTSSTGRKIPVMIEVKGTQGDFIKLDEFGGVAMSDSSGKALHQYRTKYAVNGAVHYAEAIIRHSQSYEEVIAIGINGYDDEAGNRTVEYGVYYVSKNNLLIPKKIGNYTSLSFLSSSNIDELIDRIENLELSDEEQEQRTKQWEFQIEDKLKELNQEMHDVHQISEDYRVKLISGLIMAGIGIKNQVAPLAVSELRSISDQFSHDGQIILNRIKSYLSKKNLPDEKREMIVNELSKVFIHTKLYEPVNGESPLKSIYAFLDKNILPLFNEKIHVDFTGKLFNTLNAWVKVPDGNQNDVVLTPRYVCEMMASICKVNMDSFVWDYALGSAGFLIAAMKQMISDAQEKLKGDPSARDLKIQKIKAEQLLGIEKLPDIYMLAVLNMLLMNDGSANILYKDSLTYEGQYEQGSHKGEDFPANVFLLNPPYSAEGKGMIFVEKALSKMKSGRAAVLIQENAGSGNGLPFTKRILEHSSLIASIHMSDLFKGKASVQTAVYVFEVGTPHDPLRLVKFIDFSNDGYTRQNRKKANSATNLRDTDNAIERYAEVVDLVLDRKPKTEYLKDCINLDTITLNGNDWTVDKHKKIDPIPQEADFRKTVADYLSWKVSTILQNREGVNFQ
ncbi:MAG: N-6 DNA methylase [Muribaculaceae bacterium]|nr:N-6 DNA methylase [Muribaculaceae bacterium]